MESRGKASGRPPQRAELSCAYLSAGGGLRGNPRRGFPLLFILALSACAPILWAVVVSLSCDSTPFLWCLPKETVSSRQRKALFLPRRLHHSRERYQSVGGTFLARLGEGAGVSLLARSAFESFVHLFKGGGVQGQRPCPPAAAGGSLLCSHKRRRGFKGEPSPGVPPFFWACTCAPLLWAGVFTPCCHSTPFLWCLPKETVSSRQRKALFYPGGSTIRVSATSRWAGRSSPDLGRGFGGYLSGSLRRGRTGPVMTALRGWSASRVSLSLSGSAYRQKRVSLGLHPVSLRKSKEMGWNRQ